MFYGFGTIRQNVDQMVWGGFIYFDVYSYISAIRKGDPNKVT
jgi:hypothetical protein